MRQTTEYGSNHAYVLTNDKFAEDFMMSFIDDFMKKRNDDESFVFIAYHVSEDIILLHFKKIENEMDFNSAIQLIKEDIQGNDFHADDSNLKKALRDPQATTAEILLNYIASEE